MPACTSCNNNYPQLSDCAQCGHCTKLQGKSATERRTIENSPQCHGCGTVFKAMGGPICGCCTANSLTLEDTFEELDDNIRDEKLVQEEHVITAAGIMQQADTHCSTASAQCLKKQPKNLGLQKAENYTTLKQAAYKDAAKKSSKLISPAFYEPS
ncbi:hypothetical protein M422DRAFT_781967, partial [Sphaerobolus stellatus SS14]